MIWCNLRSRATRRRIVLWSWEADRIWVKLACRDRAVAAVLVAALISCAVWGLVLLLGLHEAPANAPASYEPYFQQINWWPVPFIFLALAPALWLTWRPMLHAWGRLAEDGVLLGPDGAAEDRGVAQVLQVVQQWRGRAVLASFVIAIVVNVIDWAPNASVYLGGSNLAKQIDVACHYPNSAHKWIFEAEIAPVKSLCNPDAAQLQAWSRADAIKPPYGQLMANLLLMAQQFFIVFFSALAVVQVLLHTFLFAGFERLAVARAQGLHLALNCQSPLNEFGLEHWNFALNNFYWAASPALLGVFLSRIATPEADYLPGQAMLGILVPACLILPMVATVLARQARLPAAWAMIQPKGPVAPEDYRRQQLWPLDRNWSSKLGILLAFALAALSIGFEVSKLVKL